MSLKILRRGIEKCLNQPRTSNWVFFNRGLIDALGRLHEASLLPAIELATILTSYPEWSKYPNVLKNHGLL